MQAKAEWAKKHPSGDKTPGGRMFPSHNGSGRGERLTIWMGSVITDPNDSRFDLEAYLKQLAADDKKARA